MKRKHPCLSLSLDWLVCNKVRQNRTSLQRSIRNYLISDLFLVLTHDDTPGNPDMELMNSTFATNRKHYWAANKSLSQVEWCLTSLVSVNMEVINWIVICYSGLSVFIYITKLLKHTYKLMHILTILNTKMYVCLFVCTPFSRPFRNRLRYFLAQSWSIVPRVFKDKNIVDRRIP